MTPAMIAELERHTEAPIVAGSLARRGFKLTLPRYRTAGNPRAAAALFRRGLLLRRRQSEHERGQRRTYWWIYAPTDAGWTTIREIHGPGPRVY